MRVTMLAVPLLMLAGCGGGSVVINATNEVTAEPANAANAAAPAPAPAAPSVKLSDFELNQPIRATGTEPFWMLDLAPGDMVYHDYSVDEPKPEPFYWVAPVLAGGAATYTTKNVAGEVVVLTLTRKDCLVVGEPEDTQPLTVELKVGAKTMRGCAGPRPRDEPDEEMENTTAP